MAKLIASTACAGLLPKTIGTTTLTEVVAGPITLVAPLDGGRKATSEALKAAIGIAFPNPNRTLGKGPRAIWCGLEQALIVGIDCPVLPQAICVDHTDAWAIVRIEGDQVEDVLARLVPVDLRPTVFKRGHTARTLIGHMNGGVTRVGSNAFEIMVMRSMAGTLVHDLESAANGLAARRV